MPPKHLVVVGASAGGIEALRELVRGLPAGLPAAVCVVVHQPARAETQLPQLLSRAGSLPADRACDGDRLLPGRIYVCPPDAHLVVQADRIRLLHSARENGHRPAIDPLFRSAAQTFGKRTIAVILSGADDDGTEGLLAVKARGGVALVQDPGEALFQRMPASAIAHLAVDRVLPAAALGPVIARASNQNEEEGQGESVQPELDPEREREQLQQRIENWGAGEPEDSSSGLTCPLCGGAIWIGTEGPLSRFHCHTGHEFSDDSFMQEQALVLETTLWRAVRSLSERQSLLRRLAGRNSIGAADNLVEEADALEDGVSILRRLLQTHGFAVPADESR